MLVDHHHIQMINSEGIVQQGALRLAQVQELHTVLARGEEEVVFKKPALLFGDKTYEQGRGQRDGKKYLGSVSGRKTSSRARAAAAKAHHWHYRSASGVCLRGARVRLRDIERHVRRGDCHVGRWNYEHNVF